MPPITPLSPRVVKTQSQQLAEAQRALYLKKFDKTSKKVSDEIRRIIILGVDANKSVRSIVKQIMKETGIGEAQAERIVRNEVHSVRSILREIRFLASDPAGSEKYIWQTTPDKRRTPICKRIAERSKGGVDLGRLKAIIAEEADKKIYRSDNPWLPHIGCRSVARRKFDW